MLSVSNTLQEVSCNGECWQVWLDALVFSSSYLEIPFLTNVLNQSRDCKMKTRGLNWPQNHKRHKGGGNPCGSSMVEGKGMGQLVLPD